jgi:hypothetical protein
MKGRKTGRRRPQQNGDTGYRAEFHQARRKGRRDWAGSRLGDAFDHTLYHYERLPAQREFYARTRQVQHAVARHLSGNDAHEPKSQVKPQLSPCYSSYPSTLAAWAAIGLTGYLEAKACLPKEGLLEHSLSAYLADPAAADQLPVEPKAYTALAKSTVEAVEARLVLHSLAGIEGGWPLEAYRLFAASQQEFRAPSMRALLRAVVLYGDVLVLGEDDESSDLHHLTAELLEVIRAASMPFQRRLPRTPTAGLLALAGEWVRAVCRALAPYLPSQEAEQSLGAGASDGQIGPLEAPRPPVLGDSGPGNLLASLARALATPGPAERGGDGVVDICFAAVSGGDGSAPVGKLAEAAKALGQAVQAATAVEPWQDVPSDLLDYQLACDDFSRGALEGSQVDGHPVETRLGDETVSAEIFEGPIELSDDLPAHEALLADAYPIAQALRPLLYPNVEEVFVEERLRPAGRLDPRRLPVAEFCQAVYRLNRVHRQVDPRGRSVLAIVCDGSGSLTARPMRMLKLLTAAMLQSVERTRMRLLAGLYHDTLVRPGLTGPMIHWLYHPRKTPALGPREATLAIAALPDAGSGDQSDALSLAFMIEEAKRLAPGCNIYLTLITDLGFCSSYRTGRTAPEEVRATLETAYQELVDRLQVTFVVLGRERETGFEDLVDVVRVSSAELEDVGQVAERVGTYVASAMQRRRRMSDGK